MSQETGGSDINVDFELEEQGNGGTRQVADNADAYDENEAMGGEAEGESDDGSEGESEESDSLVDASDESDDEDYALDDHDSEASDEELIPQDVYGSSVTAERRVDLRFVRAASFQPAQIFDAHPLVSETERATHATTCALGPEALTSAGLSTSPKSPVSVHKMIHRREANLTGVGRFRKSDCCHIGLRHIPQHPVVREDVSSRGYIGQYSENGEWFIAGFQDRRIKIYEVHNEWRMRKEITARGLRWTITDTCMSPDRNFLVYSSITPVVHMVSTAAQSEYERVSHEEEKDHYALHLGSAYDNFGIWGISFSPDGREIVAGTSADRLIVYDVETNKNVVNIIAHTDDINSVAFVDEASNLMVSGSDDTLCKVWDRRTATPTPEGVFVGHTEGVAHVSPKGDGRYFISNSKDQSIKLWDLRGMRTHSEFAALPPTKIPKYHWDYRWMEYPPFSKHSAAFKGHPYDASIMTYRGHAVLETLIRSYFSPLHTTGQRYIYSGSHDGRIYVYDLITGEVVALLERHVSVVRDCSWHPTEPKLVSCSWDGTIVEWSHDPKLPVCSPRLEDLKRSVCQKKTDSS